MLVLSRKQKQSIRIGDDIEITVVQVQGNRVRLAIEAPKHVPIHRNEIAERIAEQDCAEQDCAEQAPTLAAAS